MPLCASEWSSTTSCPPPIVSLMSFCPAMASRLILALVQLIDYGTPAAAQKTCHPQETHCDQMTKYP